MRKVLLIWVFFILSLKVLSQSACESTFAKKAGDRSSSKLSKHLNCKNDVKDLYAPLMKPNREGDQRTHGADHGDHQLRVFQKAKVVYGGANNVKPPNTRRRSGANSLLIKPSSGVFGVLGHVIFGLLMSVFIF
ncbi:uncharacterized protein LOC132184953 [Corylus avellana]|uniref:uncharacterized protein LOC132184953 n=1 Tax=Corylus avellana TaxID=13451 RepID=UPI00286B43F0|nr:uncharacterized protein LOC132184953 [Corylus avellana]